MQSLFTIQTRGSISSSRSKSVIATASIIRILFLLATIAARIIGNEVDSAVVPNEQLALGLSLSSNDISMEPQTRSDPAIMTKIMQDDISGEFSMTESVVEQLTKSLETFGMQEKMGVVSNSAEGSVSGWLNSKLMGRSKHQMVTKISEELDFIFANHWSRFLPLIQKILQERPANLGVTDIAYRCDKLDLIAELQKFSSASSLYAMLLDVFNTELYIHCYRRKLALIRMLNIEPSVILRQFVDIYLGLPGYSGNLHGDSESNKQVMAKIMNGVALDFDIRSTPTIFGPLEQAANLVFDSSSGLTLGATNTALTVNKFKHDCKDHTEQLAKLWSNFDQVSIMLSSQFNNLQEFNRRAKLIAPQLVYGSLCSQLASI